MPGGRSIDEKMTINGSSDSGFVSSMIGISTDRFPAPPGMKVMVPL